MNKTLSGEIEHQFMNYQKLYKYFKWKPLYSLNDGLSKTITWYKSFLKKYNYKIFIEKL